MSLSLSPPSFQPSVSLFFLVTRPPEKCRKDTSKNHRVCSKLRQDSFLRCVPPACVFTGSLRGAVAVRLAQLSFPSEDLEALWVHPCPLVLSDGFGANRHNCTDRVLSAFANQWCSDKRAMWPLHSDMSLSAHSDSCMFSLLSAGFPARWSRRHHTSIPSSTPHRMHKIELVVRAFQLATVFFSIAFASVQSALLHSTLAHTEAAINCIFRLPDIYLAERQTHFLSATVPWTSLCRKAAQDDPIRSSAIPPKISTGSQGIRSSSTLSVSPGSAGYDDQCVLFAASPSPTLRNSSATSLIRCSQSRFVALVRKMSSLALAHFFPCLARNTSQVVPNSFRIASQHT